jgi:hypothetical protein
MVAIAAMGVVASGLSDRSGLCAYPTDNIAAAPVTMAAPAKPWPRAAISPAIPEANPTNVNVRTPAIRVPDFRRRRSNPRSIPISSPQASAVATDSACQYQPPFSAISPSASEGVRP